MNRVQLIGNVGADVNIRMSNAGHKIAVFSLATSVKYIDKNGVKCENVQWHCVKCYGWLADFAEERIKKGDKLFVDGSIKSERILQENGQTNEFFFIKSETIIIHQK